MSKYTNMYKKIEAQWDKGNVRRIPGVVSRKITQFSFTLIAYCWNVNLWKPFGSIKSIWMFIFQLREHLKLSINIPIFYASDIKPRQMRDFNCPESDLPSICIFEQWEN